MFFIVLSFVISAFLNYAVEASFEANAVLINQEKQEYDVSQCLNGNYQFFQYLFMSIGEVLFSISGLEFTYTQIGKQMKSTAVSLWLLTISLGNFLVMLIVTARSLPLKHPLLTMIKMEKSPSLLQAATNFSCIQGLPCFSI